MEFRKFFRADLDIVHSNRLWKRLKFRAEKIPVDAIILDLYWFGKPFKERRKFCLGQR